MKLAFVFPGQGSQSVGMMNGFAENAFVQDVVARASTALGTDLGTMMSEGPAEDLNLTVNTQPVMLTSAYAAYVAYIAAGGVRPTVMAGHSLGEYTALTAAGVFTPEVAVRLVRFRAQAMQSAVPVGVGAMAAVLGLADDVVESVCKAAAEETGEVVEPVNYNCPGQLVIAGNKKAVEVACTKAQEAGARRALILPVSAPFHSSLLKGAADALGAYLADLPMQSPAIEVIANADVEVHTEVDSIRKVLALQAASPVQWVKTILKMKEMGVTDIVECGPGKVLSGMIRRIAPEITCHNICDDASLKALLATDGFHV